MEESDKQKSFHIGNDDADGVEQTITQILDDAGTDGVVLQDSRDPDWYQLETESEAVDSLIQAPGAEKYQVGTMLARGGMGMIFNAKDVNIRRKIAMKVMLPGRETSTEQVVRFIEEAQITGQLEHPGIVPVYELGIDANGNVFYTMKLIKGLTLMEVLKGLKKGDDDSCSRYSLNHLLNIFLKVCDAVAFANSKRVVHRDLKPDNIMIGEYGEVSVLDWGLAKVLKSSKTSGSEPDAAEDITDDTVLMREAVNSLRQDDSHKGYETNYGLIMGTPRFMAPEQALGRTDEIDSRTDIYALGAILYNCLTLHSPVRGKRVKEQLMNVINGEIPNPAEYGRSGKLEHETVLHHCPDGDVPAGLAAVAMKAMAVRKADRYASVKDLQLEIENWQNGYATDAEGAGAGRMLELFVKRHKPMVSLAAASLIIIVGLLVAYSVNAKMGETQALLAQSAAEEAREEADRARLAALESESQLKAMSVKASDLSLDKALLFMKTGNLGEAADAIDLAIQLNASNPKAWFTKGRLELMQLKFEAAEKSMLKYKELNDDKKVENYLSAIKSLRGFTGHDVSSGGRSLSSSIALPKNTLAQVFNEVTGNATRERSQTKGSDTDSDIVADSKPAQGSALRRLDAKSMKKSKSESTPLKEMEKGGLIESYASLMADNGDPIVAAHFYQKLGNQRKVLEMQAREIRRIFKIQGIKPSDIDVKNSGDEFLEIKIFDGSSLSDLSSLSGLPVKSLHISKCRGRIDLGQLKNTPIDSLVLKGDQSIDLSSLSKIDLNELYVNNPTIDSLDLVAGMTLETLDISDTTVSDLSPLRGMPLKKLILKNTNVTELSEVQDLPLEEIDFRGCKVTNMKPLLSMPTLTVINGQPRAKFLEGLTQPK